MFVVEGIEPLVYVLVSDICSIEDLYESAVVYLFIAFLYLFSDYFLIVLTRCDYSRPLQSTLGDFTSPLLVELVEGRAQKRHGRLYNIEL